MYVIGKTFYISNRKIMLSCHTNCRPNQCFGVKGFKGDKGDTGNPGTPYTPTCLDVTLSNGDTLVIGDSSTMLGADTVGEETLDLLLVKGEGDKTITVQNSTFSCRCISIKNISAGITTIKLLNNGNSGGEIDMEQGDALSICWKDGEWRVVKHYIAT